MRKAPLVLVLALSLAVPLVGEKKGDFQTGKLINITSDERLVEGTSFRWAIFTVKVADVVYTARGERIRRRTGDIGRGLIVGDSVRVAINGTDLILLTPDGKELKTKITKRERPQ
ncbi:MAG: hypothetical protein ABSH50_30960 [Bryobacteraceae bacterium]|jgi:hypothetical protein